MSADRKQAIRDYKQRVASAGVFAIRCAASGEAWVGTSRDLAQAGNRERFFLCQGTHRDRPLQACWTAHGADGLVFETLESLGEDVPAIAVRDELKARAARWIAQLHARLLLP